MNGSNAHVYQLYPSSEKMMELIEDNEIKDDIEPNANFNNKYPFRLMRIGESFAIEIDYRIVHNVRMAAQYHRRVTGKKFRLMTHTEANCIEVGRIK